MRQGHERYKVKKKIIIFTSSGGGGHTAATESLKSYLGSEYEIIVLDMFVDVMKLAISSLNFTCSDGYNYALRKGYLRVINLFKILCRGLFVVIKPYNVWLIKKAIAPHKADCIISVIPLSNSATLTAAQELNIPFFIIPTDFDPRTYFYGINNATYEKFYIARVIDDPQVDSYIHSTGIRRSNIIPTGFVIRPDFFTPKNPIELKKKLHIPEKVPVAMVMFGSAGSDYTYAIARELHKINIRCHVIFCTGKHTAVRKKIEMLKLPPHVTISVIGFTKDIPDLLAVSDIFITKPSANSISEALQMNVPLVLAIFGKVISWEKFNVTYVTKYTFGILASTLNDIFRSIKELVESPKMLKNIKDNIKARNKNDPSQTIPAAMARIIKQ
jgi:UDP-N-acetylglucosamine:LPS N-acetylglucosamine transferase